MFVKGKEGKQGVAKTLAVSEKDGGNKNLNEEKQRGERQKRKNEKKKEQAQGGESDV